MRTELNNEVNWKYFDKLLENPKIPNMNMLEVCKFIYEATYMKYSIKFFEELYLREKGEQVIVQKNLKIEELEREIQTLREQLPEEIQGEDQGSTQDMGNS